MCVFFSFSGAPGVRGEPGKFHIQTQILTFLKVSDYCIKIIIMYFDVLFDRKMYHIFQLRHIT